MPRGRLLLFRVTSKFRLQEYGLDAAHFISGVQQPVS